MNESLLQRIEAHVTHLFAQPEAAAFIYHSLTHTHEVVGAVERLAEHYQLDDTQHLTVLVAAWFHDVGYLTGPPKQHEENGAQAAGAFLAENNVAPDVIARVQGCILATKIPQAPRNLLEEIMCDADLFHLGNDNFKDKTKLFRQELETLTGKSISGSEWREKNIRLFQSHHYFTDYARTLQESGKAANLRRLLDKDAEKKQKEAPEPTASSPLPLAGPPKEEKAKKEKDNRPERGIETMFRTTSTNHLRLSEIADSKANIMISVNSIMVSVVVSVLSHRLEQHPYLIPPTALFLTTALLTIIFAVLATRPNVTQGRFTKEDIQEKKANLLFFGNFYNMELEDYESGIATMMRDSDFLYSSMTRDIYYLGVVLGKKYKLLRIAYNIFMFGFVLSILAFLVVFLVYEK